MTIYRDGASCGFVERSPGQAGHLHTFVMAGLVQAIHAFLFAFRFAIRGWPD
jgi:hypothetical protein